MPQPRDAQLRDKLYSKVRNKSRKMRDKMPGKKLRKTHIDKILETHDQNYIEHHVEQVEAMVQDSRRELVIQNNEIIRESNETILLLITRIREAAKNNRNLIHLSTALKAVTEVSIRKQSGKDDGYQSAGDPGTTINIQHNTIQTFIDQQLEELKEDLKWTEEHLNQPQSLPPSP